MQVQHKFHACANVDHFVPFASVHHGWFLIKEMFRASEPSQFSQRDILLFFIHYCKSINGDKARVTGVILLQLGSARHC